MESLSIRGSSSGGCFARFVFLQFDDGRGRSSDLGDSAAADYYWSRLLAVMAEQKQHVAFPYALF